MASLESNHKPRGSGFLNDTFRKLDNLILSDCSSPITQFRATVNKLRTFSSKLSLDENWLTYRFHTNLCLEYNSYFERFAQDHDPFNEMCEPKHTLSQAMQHFQNTVTNPSKSNDKAVIAMAAVSNAELNLEQPILESSPRQSSIATTAERTIT